MPRKLTGRQSAFARHVAEGESFVSAYRAAYHPGDAKAPSVYANARRAAKNPKVQEQIRRLEAELLPAPSDLKAIYQHGMARVIELSNSAEDSRTRLLAAQWLCKESREKLAEQERLAASAPRAPARARAEVIVEELRDLYQKAFPERQARPLVEAVSEPVNEPASEVEEPEVEEPLEPAPQPSEPVAEASAGAPRFRRVQIAGRFPAAYRWERVNEP